MITAPARSTTRHARSWWVRHRVRAGLDSYGVLWRDTNRCLSRIGPRASGCSRNSLIGPEACGSFSSGRQSSESHDANCRGCPQGVQAHVQYFKVSQAGRTRLRRSSVDLFVDVHNRSHPTGAGVSRVSDNRQGRIPTRVRILGVLDNAFHPTGAANLVRAPRLGPYRSQIPPSISSSY